MPIWKPTSSDQEPYILLDSWVVYEASDKENKISRHLVGRIDYKEGRVTSTIKEFNKETMTFTTRSGRKYQVSGKPGIIPHGDAQYVWNSWKIINDITSEKDVSSEYI